ncbi:MAG: hypothetical protein KUG80_02410 [Gammaproteobacteria bacterium]|nr:hypothetical protein [Gammaproteobacteria bacterium]
MSREQFYRECYLQTGGWIPMAPLSQAVDLGDFCQINRRRVRPLGNILNLNLIEEVLVSEALHLNPDDWQFSVGIQQVFCATEQQQSSEWTKQVLEFSKPGAFMFYGNNPRAQLILNWSQFKEEITLKLSQGEFNFREIYVITGVASMADWGLVIAAKSGAKLETSAQIRTTDSFDLLNHHSCMVEQSNDIESFEKSNECTNNFFRAKKLVLSDQKKEHFTRQVLRNCDGSFKSRSADWLNTDLLNRVEANELNLANCLEFFDWVDVSLDDVEKLC